MRTSTPRTRLRNDRGKERTDTRSIDRQRASAAVECDNGVPERRARRAEGGGGGGGGGEVVMECWFGGAKVRERRPGRPALLSRA